MKNEKGFTLVELMAVLLLVGTIMVILISILMNGVNATNRNTTNQRLQQEANYISQVIRNEYLISESSATSPTIELLVTGDELWMDNQKISFGYTYELIGSSNQILSIPRTGVVPLKIKISKNSLNYTLDTKLNKLE